jgi:hypothetical protein
MDRNLFIERLDNNTKKILQLVKSLTSSQLAFKEDSKWNILEILEHLYLTDKIIMTIISKPSENIHAAEDIYGTRKIKAILVDERDKKISSPEPLKPKGIFSDVFVGEKAFLQQRDTLKNSLRAGDIIIDNRIHKHPLLGEMTISDWLNFIIHHTERHIEQIKDTADATLTK